MIIWLYHYLIGYLVVKIHGTSRERFLNMCAHHNINIWKLHAFDELYFFHISRTDFKKLRPFIRKTKIKLHIVERHGLPFVLHRYRKRKLFLAGIFIWMSTLILMSQFIWHIDINGNQFYTDESIITFLNENEIQITMKASEVDCDTIVSLLRAEFDYITWASAHIDGSELIIAIQENDQLDITDIVVSNNVWIESLLTSGTLDTENELGQDADAGAELGIDIIAAENGTISSIVTRSGTPLVHVGDSVEAGDILVSGCIELMNDSDEIIRYNYVESDADISILTEYNYTDTVELNYLEKIYTGESTQNIFLILGDYYITGVRFQTFDSQYDITTTETSYVSQQQNTWNIAIGNRKYEEYEWIESVYTESEVQVILSEAFELYCEELLQKKVEIISNSVNIYINEKNAVAKGTLEVIVANDSFATTEIRTPIDDTAQEGTIE